MIGVGYASTIYIRMKNYDNDDFYSRLINLKSLIIYRRLMLHVFTNLIGNINHDGSVAVGDEFTLST